MLCERCNQNKATLYVSEYKDGVMRESYICSDCAKSQKDTKESIQPTFENFITGILDMVMGNNLKDLTKEDIDNKKLECPNCKMTNQEFIRTGKFGCSVCYTTFENILKDAIKKIQPSSHHNGKIPQKIAPLIINKREIAQLRQKLNEAVNEERYEQAAKLRDQIKDLEKGGEDVD